ncbi:MAG: hypothetical protein UFP03_05755 [Paludibacteraceae bacterium]|jgi:hypothetical protein|nr:hypothetical protein [Paludibacteraceae bacterium]
MNTQNDTTCLEYDDDAAIAFILKRLPQELKTVIAADDVQYMLDVIYDFYESNNLLDEETDETVEIAEEELLQYILKSVKKDGMDANVFTADNVQLMLNYEYEYSKSLGVY